MCTRWKALLCAILAVAGAGVCSGAMVIAADAAGAARYASPTPGPGAPISCTSQALPCSLSAALAVAQDGDSVLLASGVYPVPRAGWASNKSLALQPAQGGATAADVVLSCADPRSPRAADSWAGPAALSVFNAESFTLARVTIVGCAGNMTTPPAPWGETSYVGIAGAFAVNDVRLLTITGCVFMENEARAAAYKGAEAGAVAITYSGTRWLVDARDSKDDLGPGVSANISISDTTFSDNRAYAQDSERYTSAGGAVAVAYAALARRGGVMVTGSDFVANSALDSPKVGVYAADNVAAGAVLLDYAYGGECMAHNFARVSFTRNTAVHVAAAVNVAAGGFVALFRHVPSVDNTWRFEDTTWTGNFQLGVVDAAFGSAAGGGLVYVYETAGKGNTATLIASRFEGNSGSLASMGYSTASGGFTFHTFAHADQSFVNAADNILVVRDCTFAGNMASNSASANAAALGCGGGIAVAHGGFGKNIYHGVLDMAGSTFTGNACNMSGAIQERRYSAGGAVSMMIYLEQEDGFALAFQMALATSVFENNYAYAHTEGGGIAVGGAVSYFVSDEGSGAFSTSFSLTGVSVTNNTGTAWGGGENAGAGGVSFYCVGKCPGATVEVVDSSFTNNAGTFHAGGMAVISLAGAVQMSLSGTNFTSNYAGGAEGGGGLFAGTRVSLVAAESRWVGNIARVSGAGISGNGGLMLQGCVFADNSAVYTGGGVLLGEEATLLMADSTVERCAASIGGGVSASVVNFVTIVRSLFYHNTASRGSDLFGLEAQKPTDVGAPGLHGGDGGGDGYQDAHVGTVAVQNSTFVVAKDVTGGGVTAVVLTAAQVHNLTFGSAPTNRQFGAWRSGGNTVVCHKGDAFYTVTDVPSGSMSSSATATATAGGVVLCQRCASGTYLLSRGSNRNTTEAHARLVRSGTNSDTDAADRAAAAAPPARWETVCRPCPFGGDCRRGGYLLGAFPSFWGLTLDDAHAKETTGRDVAVQFYQCAPGRCCPIGGLDGYGRPLPANTDHSGSCSWFDACQGDRAGRLCSECGQGYTETLGTAACRLASACHDAAWAVPLALVAATGIALYQQMWFGRPHGSVRVFLFFYQVLPLVLGPTSGGSGGASEVLRVIESTMLEALQLRLPHAGSSNPTSRGVCVVTGMRAVDKVAVGGFLAPAFIMATMVVLTLVQRRLYKVAACRRGCRRVCPARLCPAAGRRDPYAEGVVVLDGEDDLGRDGRGARLRGGTNGHRAGDDTDDPDAGLGSLGRYDSVARGGGDLIRRDMVRSSDSDYRGGMDADGFRAALLSPEDREISSMRPLRIAHAGGGDGSREDSDDSFGHSESEAESAGGSTLLHDLSVSANSVGAEPRGRGADGRRVAAYVDVLSPRRGLTQLLMFAYSSIATACLALLNCQDVDGESRMVVDVGVRCPSGWQWLAVAVLVLVVVPFPLAIFATVWRHRGTPFEKHSRDSAMAILAGPYRPEVAWFEAVQMTRRLFLIVLATFIADYFWRALALSLATVVLLLVSVAWRPFASRDVQRMETTSIAALVVIAGLSIRGAALAAAGVAVPFDDSAGLVGSGQQEVVAVVRTVLVLTPLLLFMAKHAGRAGRAVRNCCGGMNARRRRRAKGPDLE